MRVLSLLMIVGLTGCSTAPLANVLDRFYPGGVRDRDFGRPDEGGIGVGPPRPLDPLVEQPGLSIPSGPARPRPSDDGVVPPPELGRGFGETARTAALRAGDRR